MASIKIGLATVAMRSGWLVSPEYTKFEYDQRHFETRTEQYEILTYHEEKRVDCDGDIVTDRWTTSEIQERQAGTDSWTTREQGIAVSYDMRYDDGQISSEFRSVPGMGMGTRIYHVQINHPLLRGQPSWWTCRKVPIIVNRPYARLITARARHAIRRHIQNEHRSLLAAVPASARCFDPTPIWDERRHVVDGMWNASTRRVHTALAEYEIRSSEHLKDEEVVSLLIRHRRKGDVVDAWMAASNYDRPWKRNVGTIDALRSYALPMAGLAAAATTLLVASAIYSTALVFVGLGVGAVALRLKRGVDERRSSIMSMVTSPEALLRRGLDEMRNRTWRRARATHERSIGLKPGVDG